MHQGKKHKKYDWNWWFGPNSLWGKMWPDQGTIAAAGMEFSWDKQDWSLGLGSEIGKDSMELKLLTYSIIALFAYTVIVK